METRHYQTIARDAHRGLSLIGTFVSPYFPTVASTRNRHPIRNIHLFLDYMDFLVVELLIVAGVPKIAVTLSDSSTHAFNSTPVLPMTFADIAANGLNPTIAAAIATYASANSITVGLIEWGVSSTGPQFAVSNPIRALSTAYQVMGNTLVIGSIEQDASLSLSGGTKSTITLQYADDSGFTTNVKTASVGVNGNTGTLTLGLNTVGAGGGNVVGFIPASKYYKFVPANSTGTSTNTVLNVQEVTIS